MAAFGEDLPPAVWEQILPEPAIDPPPGQISDLNAPNPFARSIIIGYSFMMFFSVGLTLMRVLAQHLVHGRLFAEDYVMFVALMIQISNTVIGFLSANAGIGKHMWNITLHQFFKAFPLVWSYGLLYNICTSLIKIAILLQFIRVFTPSRINKAAWVTCWVCIVAITVYATAMALLTVMGCIPLSSLWIPSQHGRCLDVATLYKAWVTTNVVFDFILLAIPLPIIFKLRLKTKKKLLVMAVFATGVLACTLSITRVIYTFRSWDDDDTSYEMMIMGLFTAAEATVGFIIFFMPVSPALYFYVRSKLRNTATTTRSTTDQQPDHVDVVRPKAASPYELPSLATFEQSIARQTRPTSKPGPSVEKYDACASYESQSTWSERSPEVVDDQLIDYLPALIFHDP